MKKRKIDDDVAYIQKETKTFGLVWMDINPLKNRGLISLVGTQDVAWNVPRFEAWHLIRIMA